MDLQKLEKFEDWFATRYPNVQKTIDLHNDHESIVFRNNQMKAWQAAKASAVPDGYCVVPKEPTKEYKDVISQYLDDLWMGEWGCDWDGFICVNGIDPNHVWKIVTDAKAMIEAQEPAND